MSVASEAVEAVYRAEWGRIVAALISLIGDFDLAEECAQEAFAAAVDQWRTSGIPDMPTAWIIRAARNKAIDRLRRQSLYSEKLESYGIPRPAVDVLWQQGGHVSWGVSFRSVLGEAKYQAQREAHQLREWRLPESVSRTAHRTSTPSSH